MELLVSLHKIPELVMLVQMKKSMTIFSILKIILNFSFP